MASYYSSPPVRLITSDPAISLVVGANDGRCHPKLRYRTNLAIMWLSNDVPPPDSVLILWRLLVTTVIGIDIGRTIAVFEINRIAKGGWRHLGWSRAHQPQFV